MNSSPSQDSMNSKNHKRGYLQKLKTPQNSLKIPSFCTLSFRNGTVFSQGFSLAWRQLNVVPAWS